MTIVTVYEMQRGRSDLEYGTLVSLVAALQRPGSVDGSELYCECRPMSLHARGSARATESSSSSYTNLLDVKDE